MADKRLRVKSFDFIRALCTIGIVYFHYSFNFVEYGIGGNHLMMGSIGYGSYGAVFVAMFFMLSGAVMWLNYGKGFTLFKSEYKSEGKQSVWMFYLKRGLSMFPMFYIAWFFAYLAKVSEFNGFWWWGGPKKNLIYTVFGIDGYFLKPGINMNYYTLGEWFLGAILIIYLLYPLLQALFANKVSRIIFTVMLTAAYIWNLYSDYFQISDGKNMITCVMEFWMGIIIMELYMKYRKYWKYVCVVSLPLSILSIFSPVVLTEVMCSTFIGLFWMLSAMYIGEIMMEYGIVASFCRTISKYSFGIFLLHHVFIYAVMKPFAGTTFNSAKVLAMFYVLFVVIFIPAALLSEVGGVISRGVLRIIDKINQKKYA